MTEKGIQLNVTQRGKIQFVARDDKGRVSFIMDYKTAKRFRDEFQSALSQIDPYQDNPTGDTDE